MKRGPYCTFVRDLDVLHQAGNAPCSTRHDDRMLVWNLTSGKITRRIDIEVDEKNFGRSVGIAISPNGTTIAAERHDFAVHLWDLVTGKPLFHSAVVWDISAAYDALEQLRH
jgi:WD40 repeat protein